MMYCTNGYMYLIVLFLICLCTGQFAQKKCPKGKHCNFLHVFRNPRGAFSRADRDLPPSTSPTNSSAAVMSHRRDSGSHCRRSDARNRPRSRERRRRRRSRTRSRSQSPEFSRTRRRSRYNSRSRSRSRSLSVETSQSRRSWRKNGNKRRRHSRESTYNRSRSLSSSRSMSGNSRSGESERSRDDSLGRKSISPTRGSKLESSDEDIHSSSRKHSSRNKK